MKNNIPIQDLIDSFHTDEKNKVQSYEVGYVLDKGKGKISDLVKQNIMKSVYSLAASKGFRIFGDKKLLII